MIFLRRTFTFLFLVCLGCLAQSAAPDLALKIEHQMRVAYNIPPDVAVIVGAITPSNEIPGYDSVSVRVNTADQQKEYKFLLSKDRETLARLAKFDLSKDAFAEVMRKIDTAGRPVRGAKSAKVVVVNFDDFECPFCARLHQTLFPEILKQYGDLVTFIYKDDPIPSIHPWAVHAAVDANCLAAQSGDAYWDFADYIHANRQEVDREKALDARFVAVDKIALQQGQKHNLDAARLQSCIKAQDDSAVQVSMREAAGFGINGTPVLFVNGQRIDGAVSIEMLRTAIENALRESQLSMKTSLEQAPAARSSN